MKYHGRRTMYALIAYALFVILYYTMPEVIGTIAGIVLILLFMAYAWVCANDLTEKDYMPTATAPVAPVAYSLDHEADSRP
jgi:hypothetical protein